MAALTTDVAIALAQGDNAARILENCTEAIVRHLDAAIVRIWILDEQNVLQLGASAGIYRHLDDEKSCVRLGDCDIGQIASDRQPHRTNEAASDPRVTDRAWAKREGLIAFAAYPLLIEQRVVGVMAPSPARHFRKRRSIRWAPLPTASRSGLSGCKLK